MISWLYKWLPITFGCHCRADRSFFWKGKQFPICARCTGELVGMVMAMVSLWFYLPSWWLVLVLMVPMVADGFIQLKTRYESTNLRRLLTGIPFGYSLVAMFVLFTKGLYDFGYWIGLKLV